MVNRQEAPAVVIGVEQGELLTAVLGVVDIKHDAGRHLLEAIAEQVYHGHHALERGRSW